MAQDHPHHSDDSVMKGSAPAQEFVCTALEMGPEERARPRHGRPKRKPDTEQSEQPKPETPPEETGS